MKYLLDTHTLLFFLTGNPLLSRAALNVFESKKERFLSIASLWEISIKHSLGKLELSGGIAQLEKLLKLNEIMLLSIEAKDIRCTQNLEHHHRDPFDRMLIAQAMTNNMTLVTKDKQITKYQVETLW
ncbi:type II toxin-antitoxin system VapC family toxin [Owenweeksia hongkongensis]|uniref:type II toxin-antitoxin system VapC family toxin n=1 Tax=Owenweeksia hongkongensis TaxID=253245 RepID=UPI003A8F7647